MLPCLLDASRIGISPLLAELNSFLITLKLLNPPFSDDTSSTFIENVSFIL
jgi:hypothetical protein